MAEMTAKERTTAALNLKEPDRVPVGISYASYIAGKIAGMSMREYDSDGEKMAIGQRALVEKAGFDMVYPHHCVGLLAEGWGCKTRYYNAEVVPVIGEHAVKTPEDWKRLKPYDAAKVPGIQVVAKSIGLLKKWLGDRVFVWGMQHGPMCSATHVCYLADALRHVIKCPDLLTIGLEVVTESLISQAKLYEDAGADGMCIAIGRASKDILTVEQYDTIVRKWDEKLLKEIHIPVMLHDCAGEPMLDYIVDFPNVKSINWWDKGATWSLKDAKAKIGDRTCLTSGIDQTSTLVMGSPKDVEEETKDAIEQAGKGGGFILSAGCDIQIQTPLENLQAISAAAKKYGTYPL